MVRAIRWKEKGYMHIQIVHYLNATYNIATLHHPKQKPRRGGGYRQINACRKIPFQVNFLKIKSLLSISFLSV